MPTSSGSRGPICIRPTASPRLPSGLPRSSTTTAPARRACAPPVTSAYSLGKYREALKHYDAARRCVRRLGRDVDVARTLNGALQSLISLGRYDEAFASAEEARAIFDRHGNLLGLARLDSNVGNILYRQDRFDEALVLYETRARAARADRRAAGRGRRAQQHGGRAGISTISNALASVSRQARAFCEQHTMPLLVLRADYNIADLYYLRGEYTRALELYRAAQEQCDALGDTYHSALCDLDRSEIYLELNLSDEAADLGLRALGRFDKLGMKYEAAKAVTNLAIATSSQGELPRALKLFDHARRLFAREQNQVWLGLVDFYEALVLYRSGRPRARPAGLPGSAPAVRADLRSADEPGSASCCCRAWRCRPAISPLAERACDGAFETLAPAATPMLTYQAHFVLGLIREAQGNRVRGLRGVPAGARAASSICAAICSPRISRSRSWKTSWRSTSAWSPRASRSVRSRTRDEARSGTSKKRSHAASPISSRFAQPRWRRACPAR